MKIIIMSILAAAIFVGCSMKQEISIDKQIEGKTYTLEGVVPNSQITLAFTKDKINGTAGVNRYFTQYKIDGNKISLKYAASTKMMGSPKLMRQEDAYLENLSEVNSIKTMDNGKILILETTSGKKLNFKLQE